MAADTPHTILNFFRSQVLRSDYLLLDEPIPDRTRFPHEQKLEILHFLCIRNGYRTARDCEQIRRKLYTQDYDNCQSAHLLLAQAYLPDNVISLPKPVSKQDDNAMQARLRLSQPLAQAHCRCRLSSLSWNQHHYWLNLPEDIHSLLIERDSALLAA